MTKRAIALTAAGLVLFAPGTAAFAAPEGPTLIGELPDLVVSDNCGSANDTFTAPAEPSPEDGYTMEVDEGQGYANVRFEVLDGFAFDLTALVATDQAPGVPGLLVTDETSLALDYRFDTSNCLVAEDALPRVTVVDQCGVDADGILVGTVPEAAPIEVGSTNALNEEGGVWITPTENYEFGVDQINAAFPSASEAAAGETSIQYLDPTSLALGGTFTDTACADGEAPVAPTDGTWTPREIDLDADAGYGSEPVSDPSTTGSGSTSGDVTAEVSEDGTIVLGATTDAEAGSGSGEELAATGANLLIGGAALVLLAGGGLLLVMRRRRLTH